MIIAFTGSKRVGKSTACKIIELLYPGRVVRHNFKDALLQEFKYYFKDVLDYHINAEHTNYETILEKKPGCIRQLLQNFGTDVRREEDEDYWVKLWEEDLDEVDFGGDIIVADDVRFINEAEAVKRRGGYIIRLEGNTAVTGDTHISETEMESISPDYVVHVEKGNIKAMIDDLHPILEEITQREHEQRERA